MTNVSEPPPRRLSLREELALFLRDMRAKGHSVPSDAELFRRTDIATLVKAAARAESEIMAEMQARHTLMRGEAVARVCAFLWPSVPPDLYPTVLGKVLGIPASNLRKVLAGYRLLPLQPSYALRALECERLATLATSAPPDPDEA